MHAFTAYIMGVSCSICYGIATVLQQIASKRQENIGSINPVHFFKLLKQGPYILGGLLDLIGTLLYIAITRRLPLYLALSFIILSLVVTAVIARLFLKTQIRQSDALSMALIVIGIISLGLVAKPPSYTPINHFFILILKLSPIVIGLVGITVFKRLSKTSSALILATLAGLSFGGTALIIRVLSFNHFRLSQLFQSLIISLIAYAILGSIFLASAFQRGQVNEVTSFLLTSEMLAPSILGIAFLNDRVKHNLWPIMLVGFTLVLIGTFITGKKSRSIA